MSINPGNRSFPAVVIYNVDSEEIAGADAGQTVIFAREEMSSDAPLEEWVSPMPAPASYELDTHVTL